jgi:DNA (cytosine-5)-methyltransferase 1
MAGLSILWGLDKDSNSGKTWRSNFPSAKHYEMWANEFIALDEPSKHMITDILHLSPPCQVWSPVHTVPGRDDEQNFTSLFACEEVLKKARPRIVTLEQTFGILHPKFSHAFNALIQTFTFYGYSISWQLVELQRWGLPQRRHRLIILAAGYVFPYFHLQSHIC